MFKNIIVYRTTSKFNKESLIESLKTNQFNSCSSLEMESSGWVPSRQHGELVHAVDGRFLMKMMTEKKMLPGSAVKDAVLERAIQIEHEQGFYPGRKQLKAIKEIIVDEMIPRAFSVKTATYVWIDTINDLVFIDASTNTKAENVVRLLLRSVAGLQLAYLRPTKSPITMMTTWLSLDIEPDSFTIDQDGVLESLGQSGSSVKYVKHSMDNAGVKQHIESGKQCTSLALTWMDKISFVLTDNLLIKKIRPLDVLKESNKDTKNDSERFDAEFFMMAFELSLLVTDLMEDLGGKLCDDDEE